MRFFSNLLTTKGAKHVQYLIKKMAVQKVKLSLTFWITIFFLFELL